MLDPIAVTDFLLRAPPREFAFLQSVIEGYEGEAIFTTLDAELGLARIHCPRTSEKLMGEVIADLRDRSGVEILEVIRL